MAMPFNFIGGPKSSATQSNGSVFQWSQSKKSEFSLVLKIIQVESAGKAVGDGMFYSKYKTERLGRASRL